MNILFTFLIRGISWGNKLRLSMRKILKISFYLLLAVSTVVFNACSNGEDDELGNKSDGKQENTFIPDRIIDVEYAGTLKDYISEADMFRIKSLRVTGVLNGTDIDFLQRMIGDIDSYLKESINQIIESGEESLPSYTIINQDGEVSDTYIVFANGTYVFTVRDIVTGEIYEKTVDVTNINTSLEYYYIDTYGGRAIYLNNKDNNPVEFQNAYIIFKGERIDITPCIEEDNIIDMLATGNFLESIGKIENWHAELFNTKQIFEIVKDGESYFCEVLIYWSEV